MTATTRSTLLLSAIAAMLAGAAMPAAAQTVQHEGPLPDDPLLWNTLLPRNEFVLYSNRDAELIRYKSERDIEVCIARPDPGSTFGTSTAVPVEVQWDNETGEIWPGNCLSFEAKQVTVKAAEMLPEDTELRGTFRVIH